MALATALLQDLDYHVSVPIMYTEDRGAYILTLTGMFTAPELAKENGSIVHLLMSRRRWIVENSCQAGEYCASGYLPRHLR